MPSEPVTTAAGRVSAVPAPLVWCCSCREAQEFAGLEAAIDRASAERDALSERISAAAASGDFTNAAALGEELAAAEQAIDAKTERWLELAELAEG